MIQRAIEASGQRGNVKIAINISGAELQFADSKYTLKDGQTLDTETLVKIYREYIEYFKIGYILNPFHPTDSIGDGFLNIGDAIVGREKISIQSKCMVSKPDKPTVTDFIKAFEVAVGQGQFKFILDPAGDSYDNFMAHLAVGLGGDMINTNFNVLNEISRIEAERDIEYAVIDQ